MPNRDVHNAVAQFVFPNIPLSVIDDVNMRMDEPSQWLGSHHRVLYHSTNPAAPDSLAISYGNPQRELVRQLHIMLDYNKKFRLLLKAKGIIKDKDLE